MKRRSRSDIRGFTLIELTVVLVLLALATTMTVSFSSLIGKYVTKNNQNHKFYEECAELKRTLFGLVLSEDDFETVCQVEETGLIGINYSVSFSDSVLTVTQNGVSEQKKFGEIKKLLFEACEGGRAVKCTAVKSGEEEDGNVQTFLIAARCGKFKGRAAE